MNEYRDVLERVGDRAPMPEPAFERILRRRDRKRRNQRISAAGLAIVITLLSITGLVRAFSNSERPAEPRPAGLGIFSHVRGWIAYAERPGTSGIWAVDPEAPGDPNDQILLSPKDGEPVAWSNDGSRLLILRRSTEGSDGTPRTDLFVLNADGTETRLTGGDTWIVGGSFSPDGSKVVYTTWPEARPKVPARIYMVNASGGTPQVLLTSSRPYLWLPTFSPDGSKIAYFEAYGDVYVSLRVMNADGSGTRILHSNQLFGFRGYMSGLAWAPDGSHLMFHGAKGIYSLGADGSRFDLMIRGVNRGGSHAHWSPDFSRVAYTRGTGLVIADADGTHVQEFGYAGSGPWNPLQGGVE